MVAVVCIAVAYSAYSHYQLKVREVAILTMQDVVESKTSELLGYTSYSSYIAQGKDSMAAQTKFLGATIVREQSETRVIKDNWLGVPFNGVVEVKYNVEFSVGYDLSPGAYDVRATQSGIEILVNAPILVATPAVTKLRHQILVGSWPAGVQGAVIQMQQDAANRALRDGAAIAEKPETRALCEKQLISFLSGFLAKQPGVKTVPQIVVKYRKPDA
jgi:hypothetical protein